MMSIDEESDREGENVKQNHSKAILRYKLRYKKNFHVIGKHR